MKRMLLRRMFVIAMLGAAGTVPALAHWQGGGDPLCTASGRQSKPRILSDEAGGAIAVWIDKRSGVDADYYAQRINGVGQPLWPANGVPVATTAGYRGDFAVCDDGAGGAIVSWDFVLGLEKLDMDLFAQRIDDEGVMCWPSEGVPICTAAEDQRGQQMIFDGDGAAIITWQDNRSGNWNIYAQCVDTTGVAQWTVDGIAVCTVGGDQLIPQLVSDGDGGAVIVWHDQRAGHGNYDIYAQHLSATGAALWTAGGVPVCTHAGDQGWPQIATDGDGGVVVVWMDKRDLADPDLYAQALDSEGLQKWDPDGVAVCTEPLWQQTYQVTSDGDGGAIVTWYNENGLDDDVYAQRIDAEGVVQWAAAGLAIGTTSGEQLNPRIAADGSGGAMISWYDTRSGNSDIYAQWVDAQGDIQWPADGVPVCTAPNGQYSPDLIVDENGASIITWDDSRDDEGDIYAAKLDAGGGLVPILLQEFDVMTDATAIVLSWNVIGSGGESSFCVLRETDRSGRFEARPAEDITREGGAYVYRDEGCRVDEIYRYRLEFIEGLDRLLLYETEVLALPSMGARLYPNTPNPFNPATTIRYFLPDAGHARLCVYDLAGRRVVTLLDEEQIRGEYVAQWRGLDAAGRPVGSGTYFYRLTVGKAQITRKMQLIR